MCQPVSRVSAGPVVCALCIQPADFSFPKSGSPVWPFLLGSPRAPITFPRARRPLLIWILSFNLSPVLPTTFVVRNRLEFGFICVAPVCLAVFPDSSRLNTSSRPSTSHSFTPIKTH
uniref:Uncharacterized protein n=1 Tax=Nothobranchius furzeri TaxID=105023 RepID=A0A8C6KBH7_NOTFU